MGNLSGSPGALAEQGAAPPGVLAGLAAAAGALALLTRIPFVTHLPQSWDSVQYVLGVLHYDIAMHQPHPPGCFLYVHAAKLLHALGLSPYDSLLLISMLSGALMVALLTWWAGRLGGTWAAGGAGVLTLTSPLSFLHATVGDTYAVSGLSSALAAYLCWRICGKSRKAIWPSALALGVVGGFRPTDALFLMPLWLWSVGRPTVKRLTTGLAILGAISLGWFVPVLVNVGGWAKYWEVSGRLSRYVWARGPLAGPPHRWLEYAAACGLSALIVLMLGWLFIPWARGTRLTRRPLFLVLWTAPALLFYLTVHLGSPGYMMFLAPALLLLAGLGLGRVAARAGTTRGIVLVVAVAAINGRFLLDTAVAPVQRDERAHRKIAAACRPYDRPDAVVLTAHRAPDSPEARRYWLSYRLAMYLLPRAHVFAFPLESTRLLGYHPNYGHQLRSLLLSPPVRMPRTRHLLLQDRKLLRWLPPKTPVQPVMVNPEAKVWLVTLDPSVPLVLGRQGELTLSPRRQESGSKHP